MLLAPLNYQGPQMKNKNRLWSTVSPSDRQDLKNVIGNETFRESQLNNVLAELHAKGYTNAQAQYELDYAKPNTESSKSID